MRLKLEPSGARVIRLCTLRRARRYAPRASRPLSTRGESCHAPTHPATHYRYHVIDTVHRKQGAAYNGMHTSLSNPAVAYTASRCRRDCAVLAWRAKAGARR